MYNDHFGLKEHPFSITPDPQFLYLSQRHREALAHLMYGTQQWGGFIQLTGEVGTGKTTLTRALVEELPENVDLALIVNPTLSPFEFVKTLCDEFEIEYPQNTKSVKVLTDMLNEHLMASHEKGRHTVVLIDEAQNLSPRLLEQIRLLTNLETTKQKLLQIILVGQPELRAVLARKDLRQLAQRITARYHLLPLSEKETVKLVLFRLKVAGLENSPFTRSAFKQIFKYSQGIPRLVNILCDRALLGAYTMETAEIDGKIVKHAASELFGGSGKHLNHTNLTHSTRFIGSTIVAVVVLAFTIGWILPKWNNTINPLLPSVFSQESTESNSSVKLSKHHESATLSTENSNFSAKETALKTKYSTTTRSKKFDRDIENDRNRSGNDVHTSPISLQTLLDLPGYKSDTNSAFRELFKLWSNTYTPIDQDTGCVYARKINLRCLYSKGNWNNLKMLNRPAILELMDRYGYRHHVVAESIKDELATLNFGGEKISFPFSEIDPFWYGEFIILWKKPPVTTEEIRPGMKGDAIKWLQESLNEIDGQIVSNNANDTYNDSLKKRIVAFQQQHFLVEDGIVGEKTMININTAKEDLSIPLLLK